MSVVALSMRITCEKAGCYKHKRFHNVGDARHARREARCYGWGRRKTWDHKKGRYVYIDLCPDHTHAYDRVVHL